MRYSYDELLSINDSFHSVHHLNQADVDKVNKMIGRIEAIRQGNPTPTDGDKIICVSPSAGEVSKRGYLEKRNGQLSVCTDPDTPFISEGNLHTDASGGPWFPMSLEQFLQNSEFVGKTFTFFKVWGHCGMWANGTVNFQAEVFLWRVINPHFSLF
jgi:hypothetical protein